ncbi:MAG: two-component regulator propeller domain-containing protein [Bacteroidota bacterium]
MLACLWLTLSAYHGIAQSNHLENIPFQGLTINDGLSQGMVNKIIQDRHGFMWFASKDGLNRYDGYHFKVYRHDPEVPSTLADSHVQSLLEDSRGRIWAGTSFGNLDLFEDASGSFEHIMLEEDSAAGTAIGAIQQLTEDKEGNLWALSNKRVYVLMMQKNNAGKGKPWQVKKIDLPKPRPDHKLFVSKAGTIYLFNYSDTTVYTWGGDRGWQRWNAASSFLSNTIKKNALVVYDLLEDSIPGRLYMISSNGIVQLDDDKPPKLILALNLPGITRSFLDKSGNIWFTHERQLAIYNLASGKLSFVGSGNVDMQYHLTLIQSTYVDRSGLIWMGTGGYGIITLNPWIRRFHHFDNTSIFNFKERADGQVMVNNGCGCYKTLDRNAVAYLDSNAFPNAKVIYENFNDYSIPTFTDSLHRRWFADEKRVLCYNEATKEAITYPIPLEHISNNYGLSLALLGTGPDLVWLGGSEGLLCLNVATKTWKLYRNNPADKTSLSFNVIFSLCADPAEPLRYLWIGTNGGGLNRLEISTGKFKRYTTSEGLPNNVVYGVLRDDDKRLWMSTNKGLACFDPATETFKNYEDKDGLQSNEFNHDAYLRASDGTLFFGGVNGYNYFNPREIISNPVIPQIALTDLKIRNESIQPNPGQSPLSTAIYLSDKIVLPYNDNMISFEFSALDFAAPLKNMFQYKLEGFDKDWVNSGNIHSATYTNLDPGTYTFRVKGSNKDGVWNHEGTSIVLTILPPWYMTWWFRILVAFLILSAGYALYKYRLNKALELMAVRNRIASDLHDEIGSNLSNISIFSNVARQQNIPDPRHMGMLEKISEYSQISMDAMNDIVWMINARNDRFENIMVRMRTLASEIFEAKNYQLHIRFDERLNDVKLNMDKKKNFYLIFKEAVNNVAKYADGTDVWIELTLINNKLKLLIKDNGKGFDPLQAKHGNGLVNMKSRAALLKGMLDIYSSTATGTTIELNFPV